MYELEDFMRNFFKNAKWRTDALRAWRDWRNVEGEKEQNEAFEEAFAVFKKDKNYSMIKEGFFIPYQQREAWGKKPTSYTKTTEAPTDVA